MDPSKEFDESTVSMGGPETLHSWTEKLKEIKPPANNIYRMRGGYEVKESGPFFRKLSTVRVLEKTDQILQRTLIDGSPYQVDDLEAAYGRIAELVPRPPSNVVVGLIERVRNLLVHGKFETHHQYGLRVMSDLKYTTMVQDLETKTSAARDELDVFATSTEQWSKAHLDRAQELKKTIEALSEEATVTAVALTEEEGLAQPLQDRLLQRATSQQAEASISLGTQLDGALSARNLPEAADARHGEIASAAEDLEQSETVLANIGTERSLVESAMKLFSEKDETSIDLGKVRDKYDSLEEQLRLRLDTKQAVAESEVLRTETQKRQDGLTEEAQDPNKAYETLMAVREAKTALQVKQEQLNERSTEEISFAEAIESYSALEEQLLKSDGLAKQAKKHMLHVAEAVQDRAKAYQTQANRVGQPLSKGWDKDVAKSLLALERMIDSELLGLQGDLRGLWSAQFIGGVIEGELPSEEQMADIAEVDEQVHTADKLLREAKDSCQQLLEAVRTHLLESGREEVARLTELAKQSDTPAEEQATAPNAMLIAEVIETIGDESDSTLRMLHNEIVEALKPVVERVVAKSRAVQELADAAEGMAIWIQASMAELGEVGQSEPTSVDQAQKQLIALAGMKALPELPRPESDEHITPEVEEALGKAVTDRLDFLHVLDAVIGASVSDFVRISYEQLATAKTDLRYVRLLSSVEATMKALDVTGSDHELSLLHDAIAQARVAAGSSPPPVTPTVTSRALQIQHLIYSEVLGQRKNLGLEPDWENLRMQYYQMYQADNDISAVDSAIEALKAMATETPPMTPKGRGFTNIGNTCYLNSTLQAMRAIPAIHKQLQLLGTPAFENDSTALEGVAATLATLFDPEQRTTASGQQMRGVYAALQKAGWKYPIGAEQDAAELMRAFWSMSGLDDKQASIVRETQYLITNERSAPEMPDSGIEVACSIDKKGNANAMFADAFRSEVYNDVRKENGVKRLAYLSPPPFVIQSIKRFPQAAGVTGRSTRRDDTKVNVTGKVDIPVLKDSDNRDLDETENHKYEAHAIVLHHGRSLGSGHYTALVRHEDGWYHYNDSAAPKKVGGPDYRPETGRAALVVWRPAAE